MIMRYVKIILSGLLILFCLTECRQSEGIKTRVIIARLKTSDCD